MMSRRTLFATAAAAAWVGAGGLAAAQTGPGRPETLAAMKRATAFMVDKVAYQGGYVWSYLPDFSRRWGELEAKPTMIWIQPPGTGTMGHLFLDAYHATGDEYYYRAAQKAAAALIKAQHPSGGWNYIHDFAGPRSLQQWYDTYGRNAWRMEEFQHNWKNSTFDDAGTSEAMQFLLRLYLEKKDAQYRPALDKAIKLVLDSQYPIGGWPKRWPQDPKNAKGGKGSDYTSLITFNDDVAGENIKFLVMVRQSFDEPKLRARIDDALLRAMSSFIVTQQGQPQPGWGLQHGPDLKPAAARSYEPRAFATHTTAANLGQLMSFYELTGDTRYLARIPEAIDWLEQVRLPQPRGGRSHPTFIEVGTNRPLYVHRRGSNVVNGEYYVNYDPERTLGHYSAFRQVDTAALRRRYERLKATSPDQVAGNSPLKSTGVVPLPRFFANQDIQTSDLNSNQPAARPGDGGARVWELIRTLNTQGYWPTPLRSTSNPYAGPGSPTPTPGDYSTTHVGDRTDTSPYPTDNPVTGISTGTYIQNMGVLIDHLTALEPQRG